jgi:hypothetical protein
LQVGRVVGAEWCQPDTERRVGAYGGVEAMHKLLLSGERGR